MSKIYPAVDIEGVLYVRASDVAALNAELADLRAKVAAQRNAVIEECSAVADGFTCGTCGMDGKASAAIRALQLDVPTPQAAPQIDDKGRG